MKLVLKNNKVKITDVRPKLVNSLPMVSSIYSPVAIGKIFSTRNNAKEKFHLRWCVKEGIGALIRR